MKHRRRALAAAVIVTAMTTGCPKKEESGPKEVEFGLDERPSNTTCLAPGRPPTDFDVSLATAFGTLTFAKPVLLLPSPSIANRWYVVEQNGTVRTFEEGDAASTVAITRAVAVGSLGNPEGGLLGMAFHPDFASNGRAYLHYTDGSNNDLTSRVHEINSSDGGVTFTAAASPLFSIAQPYDNHNGGMIAFGPDGYLYIGLGDGGLFDDPLGAGQDTTTALGKILRVDVDGGTSYAIPADNPFAGSATEVEEIFAWGFRNPWRFSFDMETGALWVADVGQDDWEEVDVVQLGGNYGWDIKEGDHCHEGPNPCDGLGLIDPIVEHQQPSYQSITGGYVYRGDDIPELAGAYLYGDYVTGVIHAVVEDEITGLPESRLVSNPGFNISGFGQGLDGEVYVLPHSTSPTQIRKIVPNGSPATNTFPQTLSATGCFDAADPTVPAPGLIPYEVNAELWSDGAGKRRWMALPDGETIGVDAATGDWAFPLGSVLAKEFSLDGQRIETRLLVLHTDGNWAGYSYEWDESETDALLLPAGKTRTVGAQVWGYPSRGECLQCHTDAAGRSLGLETQQMNRIAAYGDVVADQMNTLEHIGMFTAAPARLDPLPRFDDTDVSTELRARSYLHANCSHCHRPGGTGQGPQDFLFDTSFADMQVCDVAPGEGNLGVNGAVLLAPGQPGLSLISLRMHALDSSRMPDVGTRVVDPDGTDLVDEWITGISACP